LAADVDVNARYGNELTALMWAAGFADGAGVLDVEQVVTLLIDRGARFRRRRQPRPHRADDRGRAGT
jgi:hypothetical protein